MSTLLEMNLIAFLVIFLMAIGITIFSYRFNRKALSLKEWFISHLDDLVAELWGAVLTAILFTLIVGIAENNQNLLDSKHELIRDMSSGDNATALRAVELLRFNGWLSDGTLRGINLMGANLQSADLSGADLSSTNLQYASLRNAQLTNTNFQHANLKHADLSGINPNVIFSTYEDNAATIILGTVGFLGEIGSEMRKDFVHDMFDTVWELTPRTDFSYANLRFADFSDSNLVLSSFYKANILNAIFSGANLQASDMTDAVIEANLIDLSADTLEGLTDEERRTLVNQFAENIGIAPPTFSPKTLLPDGNLWETTTEIFRFTDSVNLDYSTFGLLRSDRNFFRERVAECFVNVEFTDFYQTEPCKNMKPLFELILQVNKPKS